MSFLKSTPKKRALTISEAADFLCVSAGTVRNWLSQSLLPFEEFPGRGNGSKKFRLIRIADIEAFIEKYYCTGEKTELWKSEKKIKLLPKGNS